MIATCIALGIWTTGLLLISVKAEKKRVLVGEFNGHGEEKVEEVTGYQGDGEKV